MSYLIMECHLAYAVVLDENGRFIKVANLNYEVGQTVPYVLELKEAVLNQSKSSTQKWVFSLVALAASLSIVILGAWQYLLLPYGSVRMQINPDVRLTVDRLDYVIGVEGLNVDGEVLIDDYRFRWKKIERVTDELADQAIELGYLSDGGTINLIVESEHENWKIATESRIILELEVHLGDSITVTTEPDEPANSSDTIVIPIQPEPSEDTSDDDDDDGDDDDGDDDTDDNDDDGDDADDFNEGKDDDQVGDEDDDEGEIDDDDDDNGEDDDGDD